MVDVIVVGGGPAGSTCARALTRAGLRVAVLDGARFPRVKLCAGWISAPIWDVLELSPSEYPAGLWEWNRCHVHYAGRLHTVRARGWFIRRAELDAFLLARSGADVRQGVRVTRVERRDGTWQVNGELAAPFLVGAGGTHCPVARSVFPKKPLPPVGVQEHEFPADPDAVAACRLGRDGEPELILHDDLRGYSWNVPKTAWLNVGSGTVSARDVKAAWLRARDVFVGAGHVPASARPALDRMEGHSYYLFHPEHLDAAEENGALLAGDALGLAHPFTAEGILPAALSGRLAAEAILSGEPASYRRRLSEHPVMVDYRKLYRLRDAGASLRRRAGARRLPALLSRPPSRLASWAVARTFAWMFSGSPLPALKRRSTR